MLSGTYKPFMLSVVMLSVTYKPFMLSVTYKPFMLSVVMLSVIMLSVVAPFCHLFIASSMKKIVEINVIIVIDFQSVLIFEITF
jgi:hypothetical protein